MPQKRCQYTGCGIYLDNEVDDLCEFHKPLDKKTLLPEIFELQFLNRIRQGSPNFKGYIIPGRINISDIVINAATTFEDAEFHGDLNIEKCEFNQKVNFKNTKFYKSLKIAGKQFAEVSFEDVVFYGDARFDGCEFDFDINFNNARFRKCAIFANVVFKSKAIFNNANFNGETKIDDTKAYYCAIINKCHFEKGVEFIKTQFAGGAVDFGGTKFNGELTNFHECIFKKGTANFDSCQFQSNRTQFLGIVFGDIAIFTNTIFSGTTTYFISTNFSGGIADFSHSQIECDFRLIHVNINHGMDFLDTRFSENAIFIFSDPAFAAKGLRFIPIFFQRVRFIPFQTFFQNIDPNGEYSITDKGGAAVFAFRQCYLKDVYFSKCNMSLLSFYLSSLFEESAFTSSIWPGAVELASASEGKKRDRIRICEELVMDSAKQLSNSLGFEEMKDRVKFPDSRLEIAELYLRFKASADRAKDYHLASHFYQNEFEMKRLYWLQLYEVGINVPMNLLYLCKYFLYSSYKFLFGYGEKLRQSLLWFSLLTVLFAVLHMFNGIKINDKIINYDLMASLPNFWSACKDYLICLGFTLSRLIPKNYLPFEVEKMTPSSSLPIDLFLSLSNSFVLTLMMIFIGICLKRHFRRF